jgi:hypothetical protein
MGVKMLYECRPDLPIFVYKLDEPREFQAKIIELCNTVPANGMIHWFGDYAGQRGKTLLMKYLVSNFANKYTFLCNLGSSKDLATIVNGVIESGWRGDTIIVNLTRNNEEYKSIYDGLEMLSDSCFTATKYAGKSRVMQPVKIVVLANFAPKEGALSAGRILYYDINQDYSVEDPIPVPGKIIVQQQKPDWLSKTKKYNPMGGGGDDMEV